MWQSKELLNLQDIRNNVSKMYNHTELESDECSSEFLNAELKAISELINSSLCSIDQELDRLIKRDSKVFKDYRCSHCESDKIYVCEPCMVAWSDSIVIKEIK